MTTYKKSEVEEAKAELSKLLHPGDTVYCIVRHVSKSGMQRVISLHILDDDGYGKPTIRDINGYAAKAMGYRLDRDRWGLVVNGCGMDMCFDLVYSLGRVLFPQGFGDVGHKIEDGPTIRPDTREKAAKAVAKGWMFYGRNGDPSGWDNDGGYALTHKTL